MKPSMKLTTKNWEKELWKRIQYCYKNHRAFSPQMVIFIRKLIQAVIKDVAGEKVEHYKSDDLPAWKSGFNQHRQEVLEKGKKWVK